MKAKAAGWTWKNTVEKRRAAKRRKYQGTLMHNLPQEWKAELLTIEIGARGMVAQETKQDVHNMFRLLGRTKDAKQCAGKCIVTCTRGGGGAPGLGPLSVRKAPVVFKEGFRSRQYCLNECTEICSITVNGSKSGR